MFSIQTWPSFLVGLEPEALLNSSRLEPMDLYHICLLLLFKVMSHSTSKHCFLLKLKAGRNQSSNKKSTMSESSGPWAVHGVVGY